MRRFVFGISLIGCIACVSYPCSAQHAVNVKRVAIMKVIDKSGTLGDGVKLLVRGYMTDAVTNTPGYEGYDRVDIASIMNEQEFQRTGKVSDSQIKKLGEMTGADYILLLEMAQLDADNLVFSSKILEVESAHIFNSGTVSGRNNASEYEVICQKLSNKLLGGGSYDCESENQSLRAQLGQMQSLRQQLIESKKQTARLAELNKQLEEQIAGIAESKARIESLQEELALLKDAYVALQFINDSLQLELLKDSYNVYWLFGTKNELENWRNFPRSKYWKGDYRTFNTFETRTRDSKNLYLRTHHPSGSYRWDFKDPNNTRLIILDKEKFWSISRYCVIQLK